MELRHLKGNTWYLDGMELIPVFKTDEHHCILIDTGRANEREEMVEALEKAELTPVGVIDTHMHYDHHENTKFFREKHGIPVALSWGEAEICRNEQTLLNHLYIFSPGLIRNVPRLQNLICPTDRPIRPEETKISFLGYEFDIVHTPGHSPDHICVITPDDVCCVGDGFMTYDVLENAQIPFVFDVELDIRAKRKLKTLSCEHYICSHKGVVSGAAVSDLIEANIGTIERQLALFCSLVTRPMTFSEIYSAITNKLGIADAHPIWIFYIERHIRPYLECLMDRGKLEPAGGLGAPALAPSEGWSL